MNEVQCMDVGVSQLQKMLQYIKQGLGNRKLPACSDSGLFCCV